MNWKVYNSINDFDTTLWDKHIAHNSPFMGSKFMLIVEQIHKNDRFHYFVGEKDNEIVALAFYYVSDFDFLTGHEDKKMVKGIRKVFPSFLKLAIGMSATWETYGNHFWYNEKQITYSEFCNEFLNIVRKKSSNHTVIVWRDFLDACNDQGVEKLLAVNKQFGFVNAESLPISKIALREHLKEDDYFFEIKKKHRIYMRKILKERHENNLKTEIIEDYLPLVESQLYPLYSNVHANAKEYQTPILPKSFFELTKHTYKEDAKVLIIKSNEDKILAFVLLVKQSDLLNPFLIGMDYSCREYNLWYHCTWESIMYAIRNKLRIIDLGATNYSMKQKLGAQQLSNTISLRFKNRILNSLLKKSLVHFAK